MKHLITAFIGILFCSNILFAQPDSVMVINVGSQVYSVAFSPDGKTIAFISDATGEDEIYTQVPDGVSKPIQITSNADIYKYELAWSPDSKKIMWGDKKLRLQYVDVNSEIKTQIEYYSISSMKSIPIKAVVIKPINKRRCLSSIHIQK